MEIHLEVGYLVQEVLLRGILSVASNHLLRAILHYHVPFILTA